MKTLMLVALTGFSLTAGSPGFAQPQIPADWMTKTIIPQDDFVYAVGHSQPQKSEKEAKDEAAGAAMEEFVKYAGVSVEALSRSVEAYSTVRGKDKNTSDVSTQHLITAKAFVRHAVPEQWRLGREGRKFTATLLLRVPKEELDRIRSEKDIRVSLDTAFYFEDASGRLQMLTEGTVLKSGESYALYLRPSDDCYVYVYQVDALGKSYRLFPNEKYHTLQNPTTRATDLWIPNDKELLTLDQTTGKEWFYIFASKEKIDEFEGAPALQLTRKEVDDLVSFKKMGVASLKPKLDTSIISPPQQRDVLEVKRKVQGEGSFVYEAWFWHK